MNPKLFVVQATILLPLLIQCASASRPREEELPQNEWYTKYDTYPEYCSTPQQMEQRSIPPLAISSDLDLSLKILHATVIIRHGTRTPSKVHQCWDGFWSPGSDTAIWNCELKTMMAPPSSEDIRQCELNPQTCEGHSAQNHAKGESTTMGSGGKGCMFLFEKEYNALNSPPQLKNELNGTCQLGQLLLRGYAQELHNGEMLRKTYIKDENNSDSIHESMVLFDLLSDSNSHTNITDGNSTDRFLKDDDTTTIIRPYEAPNLHYRADDYQRTLMSGQVLLRGLFGDLLRQHSEELGPHANPIIKVSTADQSQDILYVNKDICPKLEEMEHEIMTSASYKEQFESSEESKELALLIKEELKGDDSYAFRKSLKDCMMSTICTDRTLPQVINDYGKSDQSHYAGYGNDLFDRLQKYVSMTMHERLIHSF